MTYEQVRDNLEGGTPVVRRNCQVCCEAIWYTLYRGRPVLEVCSCRPSGVRKQLPLGWEGLQELLVLGRIG